jgi:hypothetical protein
MISAIQLYYIGSFFGYKADHDGSPEKKLSN